MDLHKNTLITLPNRLMRRTRISQSRGHLHKDGVLCVKLVVLYVRNGLSVGEQRLVGSVDTQYGLTDDGTLVIACRKLLTDSSQTPWNNHVPDEYGTIMSYKDTVLLIDVPQEIEIRNAMIAIV